MYKEAKSKVAVYEGENMGDLVFLLFLGELSHNKSSLEAEKPLPSPCSPGSFLQS